MKGPVHESVDGVWDEESEALVERLAGRVRDVFYVMLDGLPNGRALEFLRWAVPRLEPHEFESLLIEVVDGAPEANGLVRLSGRIVSLRFDPPAALPN